MVCHHDCWYAYLLQILLMINKRKKPKEFKNLAGLLLYAQNLADCCVKHLDGYPIYYDIVTKMRCGKDSNIWECFQGSGAGIYMIDNAPPKQSGLYMQPNSQHAALDVQSVVHSHSKKKKPNCELCQDTTRSVSDHLFPGLSRIRH